MPPVIAFGPVFVDGLRPPVVFGPLFVVAGTPAWEIVPPLGLVGGVEPVPLFDVGPPTSFGPLY